ncbi:S-adenosylmethionine-dependent methyltransferase [Teratosphaeriaceae sp. CCFEE 6253]|nr:S-adenosylmethionine-dependent methyltransferase [Teratosphaeriaceae sp. CCFEE 6253]
MDRAIAEWTAQRPESSADVSMFLNKIRKSYVLYSDLLLLPSTAYSSTCENPELSLQALYDLYGTIAKQMKVTHIATTKPIPSRSVGAVQQPRDNVLRSPLDFTPLHGDFGAATCADPPASQDLDEAYWATAKQNGILQTWAPRWTMFSRGNISEKARLLELDSVRTVVAEGKLDGRGSTAVDLYAGIGYFAFSYLRAGISQVLCWDLNPWSIEGLMRGAKRNKWEAVLVTGDMETPDRCDDIRLLAFNEDNEEAVGTIERMRLVLPPVRHVNCSLLPTSTRSWKAAVRILDDRYDGWLHLHENFAAEEIVTKAEEARVEIQRLVDHLSLSKRRQRGAGRPAIVEHVNRLKASAPGVMHCVIDIRVRRYRPG